MSPLVRSIEYLLQEGIGVMKNIEQVHYFNEMFKQNYNYYFFDKNLRCLYGSYQLAYYKHAYLVKDFKIKKGD